GLAGTGAWGRVRLPGASTSGRRVVAPAQLAIASGATDAIISAIAAGSPVARSTCRCSGEPGSAARPAVTTAAPAAVACRHTCRPRNPLAPMTSRRIKPPAVTAARAASPRSPPGRPQARSLVVLVGLEPGQVRRVAEPLDGLAKALVPGVARTPPGTLAQLRRVAHQPHDLGVLRAQPLRVLHDIRLDPHELGDVLGQLADRDVIARAAVEQLADHRRRRGLADRDDRLGGVGGVGEVAGRV